VTGGEWASDRQSTNPDRQVPGDTSAREEEKRRISMSPPFHQSSLPYIATTCTHAIMGEGRCQSK